MTALGIDYSFARPSPDAIRSAGYVLVLRYFSPDNPQTHGKILFPDEAATLLGAGFDLATVFEWGANRVLGGSAAGTADGQVALTQAQACGQPDHAAIYFAVDFDIATWQLDQLFAYCDAFAAAIGPHPVGCYGGLLAVTAALGHGVRFGWQTVAWSHGRRAPGICLMQGSTVTVGGAECGQNEILASYGGWKGTPDMQQRYHLPTTIVDIKAGNTPDGTPWALVLGEDGGVFAEGPVYHGSMVGAPDFAGRKAAVLHVLPDGSAYTIEDTADELYRPDGGEPFRAP